MMIFNSLGIVVISFFLTAVSVNCGIHYNARRFTSSLNGAHVQQHVKRRWNSRDFMLSAADSNTSIYNVLDFGAIANGTGENIIAFQNALDKAGSMKGGIVYVPPGEYLFQSPTALNVHAGVTLMGSYRNVPDQSFQIGSTLLMQGGTGIDEACFIQLNEDSTLTGLIIYYPNQKSNQAPVPYPWTVCLSGNDPAVTDLECVNCWNAIKAVGTSRHYIARIQGQPINTGVYIEKSNDMGTVEDVQFKAWFSTDANFLTWQLLNGRSFVFDGAPWQYVSNTYSSEYAIGYHFIHTSTGGKSHGRFIGIGADQSVNASVQVESTEQWGILISNGMFTTSNVQNIGSRKVDPTHVIVTNTNKGNVQFSDTAFFGPTNNIAKLSGSGTTSFSQCIFSQWDKEKKGRSAILVEGEATGSLLVYGSNFQDDSIGYKVELNDRNLTKAVVTGNLMRGVSKVRGEARNMQIGLNADNTGIFMLAD